MRARALWWRWSCIWCHFVSHQILPGYQEFTFNIGNYPVEPLSSPRVFPGWRIWVDHGNSIELVLGGLLQSYAWLLACLARCQGVSRGKREKSRIDNPGKTHHDHIFL